VDSDTATETVDTDSSRRTNNREYSNIYVQDYISGFKFWLKKDSNNHFRFDRKVVADFILME
jgi:hypothetical protein